MIIVVDFGSQTCHLIARRIRELGVRVKIVYPKDLINEIKKTRPYGIIFSGGPASVYEKNAPTVDKEIFDFKIPILAICYGWQLVAHLLGGKVKLGKKEYGPEILKLKIKKQKSKILTSLPAFFRVWLSHGDTVVKLPQGFKIVGSTHKVEAAFAADFRQKIFGVQFHPEVTHTQYGKKMLANFIFKICQSPKRKNALSINQLIEEIKEKVGKEKVIGAVSGGVDSTVAAALVAKAIGKNFFPIYINNGLMRQGTTEEIKTIFKKHLHINPIIINAKSLFLKKLKGVTNPEKKRKIIGKLYIKLFEKAAKKIPQAGWLLQGTIYSDVIESRGTVLADKIKSHHNVAGLPKKLRLKLLEPLRNFYKDEVRKIGIKLGLPEEIVFKQPFPGPGQAIRIIGEVTETRLKKQNQVDQILLEELKKSGWLRKVFQSFPILTGVKSTAVKGDLRFYGEVVALRIYQSDDIMTANWARLPDNLLQRIASRIVNEVEGVSRVVYDITTKPPATMEWE